MRVQVGNQIGEFIGLLQDGGGDTLVVVRFDTHGMLLSAYHPSRVDFLDEKARNTVYLNEIGKNKIGAIKAVRAFIGMALKDAKTLVEAAPTVIDRNLSIDDAHALVRHLEATGAKAEVL